MTRPNRTIEIITSELHLALRRRTADILAIGGLLAEAKEKIPHGEWLPWLKKECSMSERSAQKYVRAADYSAKYELGSDLKLTPSALFLLSRYDRREIADAVINAAKEKHIGCNQAKEIINNTLAELDAAYEGRPQEGNSGDMQQHAKSRSRVSQRDEVEFRFTAVVLELDRLTRPRKADRFAKTPIGIGVLARLGQLLTELANLKTKLAALDARVDKVA